MAPCSLRALVCASCLLPAALAARLATANASAWLRAAPCETMLRVSYQAGPPGSQPSTSYVYYGDWEDRAIFEKRIPGAGCVKAYAGVCSRGAVVKTETCQRNTVETVTTVFDVSGTLNLERHSTIHEGEAVTLRLPGARGSCTVELEPGTVVSFVADKRTQMEELRGFVPEPLSIDRVAALAAGVVGEEVACEIRKDPSTVAKTLLRFAGAARSASDGVDPEAQTLQHLWELLFEESRTTIFRRPFRVFRKLAKDFLSVQRFKSMSLEALGSETKRLDKKASVDGKFGLPGLAHYYHGLARFGAQARGAAKTRALIFTCSFGGGHKSAANAVGGYLGDAGYDVTIVDTTMDPRFKDDLVQFTAGIFNDFIIKRQMYVLHNAYDSVQEYFGSLSQPCPSPGCNSPRKHQFRSMVLDERPDLIVTVYHMDLLPILEIAKDLGNLPVLHVATDIDLKMRELFSVAPVYPRFLLCVPFDLQASYETLAPVEKPQTVLAGYPVRAEFLRPADAAQVSAEKAKLVPPGTKVLLVMTGGGGQDVRWPYDLGAEGIGQPLHIIIVAGGNNALATSLRAALPGNVTFPDGRIVWQGKDKSVTAEVARDPSNTRADKPFYIFAARLTMLMDMADVVLTKPGGGSTAEVAYRGVPAIFDITVSLFHWEQHTVNVFVQEGRAYSFESASEFRPKLTSALKLKRSLKLVTDGEGHFLDTAANVAEAARRLIHETQCRGCSLLPPEVDGEATPETGHLGAKNPWFNGRFWEMLKPAKFRGHASE